MKFDSAINIITMLYLGDVNPSLSLSAPVTFTQANIAQGKAT